MINPASRRVLEKCGFAYQGSGLMAFAGAGRPLSGRSFPARPAGLGEPQGLGPSGLVASRILDRGPALTANPRLPMSGAPDHAARFALALDR